MNKALQTLKNKRVMILLAMLILAVIAIHPNFDKEGVAIRSIQQNSSAEEAGLKSPRPSDKPMFREVIFEINNKQIKDVEDYNDIITGLRPGEIVQLKTMSHYTYAGEERSFSIFSHQKDYELVVRPLYNITVLDETEEVTVEKQVTVNETINGTLVQVNKTVNETVVRNKVEKTIIGAKPLGIDVYDAPNTNIKKGLDLQGGTRVLLKPDEEISDSDLDIIMENLQQRLNVYGLSDIVIRKVTDLSRNKYVMVEVAGANEDEVRELISNQGKFEAKIGNQTVFSGGEDVKFVCRSADCSFAVDPQRPCGRTQDGSWQCTFQFGITLSPEAAQRQAEATEDIPIVSENGEEFLEQRLELFLDDNNVDSLRIGADLKGRPVTDISISGPGMGATRQEAILDSAQNMKKLQTLLITGSLPVKLNVVKVDAVSPSLGDEFLSNVLLVGLFAILGVALVVVIRYRDARIAVPMLITMFSEVILLLGMASLIGWNLDLAAIAGILIAVGTGVDDQIIIVDEVKQNLSSKLLNWKERIKRAFFIIMAAYATTVVAMLPLLSAGAGLVRGFALTTMLGVTFGVFVTRPAFAAIVEQLLKD